MSQKELRSIQRQNQLGNNMQRLLNVSINELQRNMAICKHEPQRHTAAGVEGHNDLHSVTWSPTHAQCPDLCLSPESDHLGAAPHYCMATLWYHW